MPHIFSVAIFIIVLAIVLSLLAYQAKTGVPPMPASSAGAFGIVNLLKEAGLPEQAIIYELGCGWGNLVIALAYTFPHARIRGIELSPFPYWIARLRTRNMPNVFLQRKNFYDCDLRDADAVTCYLMTKPMSKLAAHLDNTLKAGTPVATLTFWFRGREAVLTHGEAALYRWGARGG